MLDELMERLKYDKEIDADGNIFYWRGQELHREDGPAGIFADGTKQWCINGHLHRLNGPALEWANGEKEWYIDGVFIRREPA